MLLMTAEVTRSNHLWRFVRNDRQGRACPWRIVNFQEGRCEPPYRQPADWRISARRWAGL